MVLLDVCKDGWTESYVKRCLSLAHVTLQALNCFALYAQHCNLILIHSPPLIRVLFQKLFISPEGSKLLQKVLLRLYMP